MIQNAITIGGGGIVPYNPENAEWRNNMQVRFTDVAEEPQGIVYSMDNTTFGVIVRDSSKENNVVNFAVSQGSRTNNLFSITYDLGTMYLWAYNSTYFRNDGYVDPSYFVFF